MSACEKKNTSDPPLSLSLSFLVRTLLRSRHENLVFFGGLLRVWSAHQDGPWKNPTIARLLRTSFTSLPGSLYYLFSCFFLYEIFNFFIVHASHWHLVLLHSKVTTRVSSSNEETWEKPRRCSLRRHFFFYLGQKKLRRCFPRAAWVWRGII